jgi:hypothetical protein
LIGLTGLEDEGVTGFNRRFAAVVPDGAGTGDDVVELPLLTVRVIGQSVIPGAMRAISTSKG